MAVLRPGRFAAERLGDGPIVHPGMAGLEGALGDNINGPSLVRAPEWVERPLGRYYLYFAHHGGAFIRLAFADSLTGPWRIHAPGVLGVADGPGRGHIASPDAHVDAGQRRVRLYFHQPVPEGPQTSFLAVSDDGLRFAARPEPLGLFYFRVFAHRGWHYAYAKYTNQDGILYRSADGLSGFEPGPRFLPGIRHAAARVCGDELQLFYSVAGDLPERILLSTFDLSGPWTGWAPSTPEVVLEPERDWEGARLPLAPSRYGAASGPVRQLRDPALYEEEGALYLLYSVAGEQGIAIARLHERSL